MNPEKKRNFKRLMSPESIAFFGGNDVEVAISEARRRGFKGLIWPVNPKRESIKGIKCFKSINNLPAAPDASFIAVPSQFVSDIVRKLAVMGAGGAVCYSAGFSETGQRGKALENELNRSAPNMPIIGPNCYGFINYLENVALWPFAHGGSSPGYGAAIITQSGMLSSDITMTQRSVPLTHMISVGNQASVSIEDVIDILRDNPSVRAIGIHIEGIKDIHKLHEVALKAIKKNIPIVALKTGTSSVGESLITTHTGSMSGEDTLYDALFHRTGIIRVKSPILFLELLKFLCTSGVPKDNSLVAFTCSGGGATMIADHAEKIGVSLPQYNETNKRKLQQLLPKIATVSNPLDYTTPIWGNEFKTFPVFLNAMNDSLASIALLLQDYPARGLDESEKYYVNDARSFIKAAKTLNLPAIICSTFPENMKKQIRDEFASQNISPMLGIEDTLDSIKLGSNYKLRQKQIEQSSVKPLFKIANSKGMTFLNEVESKILLETNGLGLPKRQLISSKEIKKTKILIQFPVVLKLVNNEIIHKTEHGAVSIDIKSKSELVQKIKRMYGALKKTLRHNMKDQFLIEEMWPKPVVEMLIGINSDPQFGYSLLLGAGGTQAEVLNDAISLLLPTNKTEIILTIQKLKLFRLMDGFRSVKKINIDSLASTILKITLMVETEQNYYSSIEINPLFVYENSTCAVDAVIAVNK